MRRWAVSLLVLFVTAAAAACGGSSDETGTPPPTMSAETSSESSREQAPALAGRSLDGAPLALADFRGRPVLVNVWSSW
jgi:hypothetical protein